MCVSWQPLELIPGEWRGLRRDVPDGEEVNPAPRTGGLSSTSGQHKRTKRERPTRDSPRRMGHLQVGVQQVVAQFAPGSLDAGLEGCLVKYFSLAVTPRPAHVPEPQSVLRAAASTLCPLSRQKT